MKEIIAHVGGGFKEIERKLAGMESRKQFSGKERTAFYDSQGRGSLRLVADPAGGGGTVELARYNEENGCFDLISTRVVDFVSAKRIFGRIFSLLKEMDLEMNEHLVGRLQVRLIHIDMLGNFVAVRGEADAEELHEIIYSLGIESEKIMETDFAGD